MTEPTRRPYTGSCHCGNTRYVLFLTMPHEHIPVGPKQARSPPGVQNFYRCNCTVCHKAGILHVRPLSPPDDFLLLSPSDPAELGDYVVPKGATHWYFCKNCGMRCFSFKGNSETVDTDVEAVGLQPVAETLKRNRDVGEAGAVKAWRPKKTGWNGYLSINGVSLDAGQEGLDLREWREKDWLLYIDCLSAPSKAQKPRYERPHEGGVF